MKFQFLFGVTSEYNQTLLVDEKGYINPDSYGRIYVKGLTFKKCVPCLKINFLSFLTCEILK